MINIDELLPGTILQRRYEIVEIAGGGGMGLVYKAIDLRIKNNFVAIKELKQDASASQEEQDRNIKLFKGEVAILGRLQHPNIPHFYGSFQENGRYYLVMDYIEGDTLMQKLQKGHAPLPLSAVLSYAIQLCEVLAYLHNGNPQIIFRDLKPSNVIVNREGKVFLIDFGIARYFKPEQPGDTYIYGTKGYIDPELIDARQSNPCSDLYSLGATLHQCLTARSPGDNTNLFVFRPIRSYNARVPVELDRLILHLLAEKAVDRPQSAKEVYLALLGIQNDLLASKIILPSMTTQLPQPVGWDNSPTVAVAPAAPTVRQFSDVMRELLVPLGAWGAIIARSYTAIRPHLPSLLLFCLSGFKTLFLLLVSLFRALFSPQGLQIGQKVQELSRQVGSHIRQWSFTSSVWTRQFLILLVVLFTLIISASIYLIKAFHFSFYAIDLCISLLLLLAVIATGRMISRREPRNALIATGAAILFFLLALLLLPAAGQVAQASTQPLTLNHLLSWVVLALACAALIGSFLSQLSPPQHFSSPAQPSRRWLYQLPLVTLLATGVLLQYSFGNVEPVPFVPGFPLATLLAQGTSQFPVTINILVCGAMLFIAFILLLPKASVHSAGRWFFAIAALPSYLLLQWDFGLAELQHFFPSIDPNTAVSFNVLVCVLLVIAFIVFLRSLGNQLDLYGGSALLIIAIICVSLQNFMGDGISIQQLSFSISLPIFKVYLFIPALLLIAALFLLFHFKGKFNVLDRLVLSTLAITCAVIESTIGQWELRNLGSLSSSSGFSALNEAGLAHLYLVLSLPLVILVILATLIAISVPFLSLPEQISRVQRVLQWIDRTTMLVIIASAWLLLFSFLMQEQVQPNMQHPELAGQTLIVLASLNILVLVTMAISFLVLLGRFSKPQGGGDRFILIVCMLAFIMLLLESKEVQQVPGLTTSIQRLVGEWFQPSILSKALAIGLIGSSLISLYWLSRPFQRTDRFILGITFALSILLAWFQFSHLQYIQIFLALLLLLFSVLAATQIERVRIGSGP